MFQLFQNTNHIFYFEVDICSMVHITIILSNGLAVFHIQVFVTSFSVIVQKLIAEKTMFH